MADILADYNGIIALVSVLAAIAIFFVQYFMDRRRIKRDLHDTIRRFTNTILVDIKQIHDAKTGDKYKQDKRIDEKKKIEYTPVYISTKVYESFIYSGLIAQFDSQTQLNLDDLYYKIDRSNDSLKRRTDAVISRDSGMAPNREEIQKVIDKFEVLLTEYEKEILDLLVEAEKNLRYELEKIK